MIGNPRKADLLKSRADTMQIMTFLLEKVPYERDPSQRAELMEAIKKLGQISKETKELIEKEDREGVPEKWVKYYEFIEKFNSLCQQK